jgi:signal transduction histidine kinase
LQNHNKISISSLLKRVAQLESENKKLSALVADSEVIEDALRTREMILHSIALNAEQLLSTSTWETSITDILKRLGRAADVSRVYILKTKTGDNSITVANQCFEWTAQNAPPMIAKKPPGEHSRNLVVFDRWVQILIRGDIIQGHVRDFPATEQDLLLSLGTLSTIIVPIIVDRQLWGIFGFDECRAEREWPETSVDSLKTAASIFGAAIRRKRSEKKIIAARERFTTVLNSLDALVYVSDLTTHEILFINEPMRRIFGEVTGQICWKVLKENTCGPCETCAGKNLTSPDGPGSEPVVWETNNPLAGGWFEVHDQAIPWIDGRNVKLEIAININDRKRAEEEDSRLRAQLLQAQKHESLGVLAGGIAHDFNNLLAGILGNSDLALMDIPRSSPAHVCLKDITKASRRASELTRQMLAYSGKGHFVIKTLNLSEIVDDMAYTLSSSVPKKITLRTELATGLPHIEADTAQMKQTIMNLVTNASEAFDKDRSGTITISTGIKDCSREYMARSYLDEEQPAGKYVTLEVSDTGTGIDIATLDKIFDPFFSTKFTGRGLGLAAVMGIVRGHKGALIVDSIPDKGSSFSVLFPVSEHSSRQYLKKPDFINNECGDKGTILLVDDEETVLNLGKRMLERSGFSVITATDGKQGVGLFREHADQISCVLLDMTMPLMNGEEALLELRKIRPNVPVILLSGYDEKELMKRCSLSGLNGFIQKPYELSDFRAQVVAAIKR